MEGSSCPPSSPIPTSPRNGLVLPAMESVNSLVMPDYLSDANSIAEINSPMLNIDAFSTPKKRKCFSQDGFLFNPECAEDMKPKIGMLFEDISSAEKLNAAFFFEYEVDEYGKLVRLFWADATSRKNYKHFPDVLSFDSTYSTNQYDMIFAPFTGINHHMQSVFFAAEFLANETVEEYTWMFQAFLRAMGGIAPRLIITDECAQIGGDEKFWERLNKCVWRSETPAKFEERWHALISDFKLESNVWLSKRFDLLKLWIPAYFMDIPLASILRTTSRSESENSFFKSVVLCH